MQNAVQCPQVAGSLDSRYLAHALARAGRPFEEQSGLRFTPLTDGRTGAEVTRIANGPDNGYVLKAVPADRGFNEGLGNEGEGRFWLSGLTRDLPQGLTNPTLDAAYHSERGQWWLLMDDVSADVYARPQWTQAHSLRLFETIAALHAQYWGADAEAGAGTVAGTTSVFLETALHAATGTASAPWVERASREFPVAGNLMPAFLDALGPDDADFYIEICRQWPRLIAALEQQPQTLIHGDLRWQNIALTDERVVLFDWELFARAPPAVDLTWHWFFVHWAYPQTQHEFPDAHVGLRDAYLDRLEALLGQAVDRDMFNVSWDLGWLRMFCQLGFLLADPLTENDATEAQRAYSRYRCRTAAKQARSIFEAHLG